MHWQSYWPFCVCKIWPVTIKSMQKKTLKTPLVGPKDGSAKREVKARSASAGLLDRDMQSSIPYLIARAGVRIGQAFTRELRKFDLTLTEWRVCSTLHHVPHQRLSEVALNTSTEASTLSRIVDGLLQRGLLLRDRSNDDARALALSLTQQGVDMTQRVIPIAQLYERVSLNGFSADQVEQLRQMLRLLYNNMAPLDHQD